MFGGAYLEDPSYHVVHIEVNPLVSFSVFIRSLLCFLHIVWTLLKFTLTPFLIGEKLVLVHHPILIKIILPLYSGIPLLCHRTANLNREELLMWCLWETYLSSSRVVLLFRELLLWVQVWEVTFWWCFHGRSPVPIIQ